MCTCTSALCQVARQAGGSGNGLSAMLTVTVSPARTSMSLRAICVARPRYTVIFAVPGGSASRRLALAMKIVRFKGRQGAIVAVFGVHPGIIGRIGAAVGGHHGDSRRHLGTVHARPLTCSCKLTHGLEVVALAYRNDLRPRARVSP